MRTGLQRQTGVPGRRRSPTVEGIPPAVGSSRIGSYSIGSYSVGNYRIGSYSVGNYGIGSYSVGTYKRRNERMKYHILAFGAGFLLDQIFGDPYFLPHPIRGIGWLIAKTEKALRSGNPQEDSPERAAAERRQGKFLVVSVLLLTGMLAALILVGAYALYPRIGMVVEAVMTYQILAARCLQVESGKVWKQLKAGNLEAAREAVSMIVGRDTQNLTEEGVAKAAIETVAENTSDGVIAPMLYTALGGPVLGFLYKAVNTMDSMVGYKNDRYLHFGRAAAKLDDVVNFLPARISALLMIGAAFLGGKSYDGRQAWRIWHRDSRKHASPNSAQTESVCAGALGIQLAGDASYFGKVVKKPYIGDPKRQVEYEDIRRANRLMNRTAWICEILCLGILMAVAGCGWL